MSDTQFILIGENTLEVAFVMEVSREMNDHAQLYGRYKPNQHDIGSISGLTETLSGIDTKEGNLEDLITDNKENLVGAINEVDSHADTNATNLENHIADKNNPHEVTKAQVGLGNVDNTSDLNKPISNATQGALDLINEKIPENASSSNQLTDKSYVDTADNDLQSQIDAIEAKSDVTDIVGTYAELQAYDTSKLTDGDVIKVLQDETQNDAITYYRWVVTGGTGAFELIGSEGPYYTVAETDTLLGAKQNTIDSTHKLDSDLVDDSGQTNKFVTASEKSQITTNANNISSLQTDKADKSTTYTKTEVDTALGGKQDSLTTEQLNAVNSGITAEKVTQYDGYSTSKANVGLDNLSADGQMIIDSANGTISNCVLEAPKKIKLELSSNVLTLKSGSTITKTGSTYETLTTTQDQTKDLSMFADGMYYILPANNNGSIQNPKYITKVGSGDTLPADNSVYDTFFNITDFAVYRWVTDHWATWGVSYPICMIKVENGTASILKDSYSNDIIFDNECFIGHHLVFYPQNNIGLCSDGIDDKGKLKSTYISRSSVYVVEMDTSNQNIMLRSNGNLARNRGFSEVEKFSDIVPQSFHEYYVRNENVVYRASSNLTLDVYPAISYVDYTYDGSVVTKFDVRKPVRLATTEMIDNLNIADKASLSGNNNYTGTNVYVGTSSQHIGVKHTDITKGTNPQSNYGANFLRCSDSNDATLGSLYTQVDTSGNVRTAITAWSFNSSSNSQINVYYLADGTSYGTCPTASATASSKEILNAEWLTTLAGYDGTKSQTLHHVNGVWTWVDD